MKKVISVIGNRPNTLKWSVLSLELRKEFEEVVVHTGQHYNHNMNAIFFKDMNLVAPDYLLNVGSATHGKQTGEMLSKIEEVLFQEEPDCVIVYGDTNTTLAGALAASKLNIKVAHVEAGVRSFNRKMPEELNRILVDNSSDYLFCPTQKALFNLEYLEGEKHLCYCGDVLVDLVHKYAFDNCSDVLNMLDVKRERYYVLTIHREENTIQKEHFVDIVHDLFSREYPVVFPCHPRTFKQLMKWNIFNWLCLNNINVIKPRGYIDMLYLIQNAKRIYTDSGGVQREALFLDVPCTVLRKETEWDGLENDPMFNKTCACKTIVNTLKEVL